MNSILECLAGFSDRFCGLPRGLAVAAGITFLLSFNAGAQPANDAFANRASLSGTNIEMSASLAYASGELEEPVVMYASSGQTAWWSWTAPHAGIATLSAQASTFSPLLAVYVGEALGALSLVASNNYLSCYSEGCGCHYALRERISFHVKKGETYQIAVDSGVTTRAIGGSVPGGVLIYPDGRVVSGLDRGPIWTTNVPPGDTYTLRLDLPPRSANDDFKRPVVLQGKRTRVSTSNAGATKEPGEPDHGGNPGGSSVWFSWKAPASGQVMLATNLPPVYQSPTSTTYGCTSTTWSIPIWTCGTDSEVSPIIFYPLFGVYRGSAVDALNPMGTIPVALEAYPNAIYFDAVKDHVYRIAYDGNRGTTGRIKLHLALTTPAANDQFEKRIQLRSIYATATSYNAGASRQPGDPVAAPGSVGKTVWWSWQAPVSGPVNIDLTRSDFVFPVQVFAGSSRRALTLVGEGQDVVSFEATVGKAYQIAVYDAAGQTGTIRLALNGPIVPLALNRVRSKDGKALLEFAAKPGQKVLLQRSEDGFNWVDRRVVTAHQKTLMFMVSSAPTDAGPFYRAIVIDRKF
jgi:hypothetical protein